MGLVSHWPCHRQQWYYHLWAHGLGKGDEHSAYTSAAEGQGVTTYGLKALEREMSILPTLQPEKGNFALSIISEFWVSQRFPRQNLVGTAKLLPFYW